MSTPQYPAGTSSPSGGQPPQNGLGTAALVLGIVSFFCIPFIGSILAIIFGKMGMTKADQGLATNKAVAQWGFWLGIVGLILAILGMVIWIVLFAAAVGNGQMTITTN